MSGAAIGMRLTTTAFRRSAIQAGRRPAHAVFLGEARGGTRSRSAAALRARAFLPAFITRTTASEWYAIQSDWWSAISALEWMNDETQNSSSLDNGRPGDGAERIRDGRPRSAVIGNAEDELRRGNVAEVRKDRIGDVVGRAGEGRARSS